MRKYDNCRSGIDIEVKELNGSTDESGDQNFITRVYRREFLVIFECCGCCLHNIFLFFDERMVILRTAKVIFQCVTKHVSGQNSDKKGIMFARTE